MNRLLEILYAHLSTIVFLILETIAVLLFCYRNDFQHSVVARAALTARSHIDATVGVVSDYFGLKAVNDSLVAENIRLREQVAGYSNALDSLRGDSIVNLSVESPEEITSARVVYKTRNLMRNYLIIDRGRADGIESDMGVTAGRAAVGVVETVAEHHAVVLLLTNVDVRVSAKLGRTDQLGMLGWDGVRPTKLVLDEVPSHVRPHTGDSVLTSSYSTIFPENILLGFVSRTKSEDVDGYNHIIVDMAVDYNKLRYVAVRRSRAKAEIDQLSESMDEQQTKEEEE